MRRDLHCHAGGLSGFKIGGELANSQPHFVNTFGNIDESISAAAIGHRGAPIIKSHRHAREIASQVADLSNESFHRPDQGNLQPGRS
jgi:hypothetical protein